MVRTTARLSRNPAWRNRLAETSRVLVEAEKVLLGTDDGSRGRSPHLKFPAVILRVAGIYGPERGHWFKQFLRGEARIEGDGSRFLNMIHRDDVVGCIIAALKNGRAGEIYNAVDNEPVSQIDFFKWLAAELRRPAAAENSGGRRNPAQARRDEQARQQRQIEDGVEIRIPVSQFPGGLCRGNCRPERGRLVRVMQNKKLAGGPPALRSIAEFYLSRKILFV